MTSPPAAAFSYLGSELELMRNAHNWKRYLARQIAPFVRGSVLEVGGGIGSNRVYFLNSTVSAWTALEPDPALAKIYREDLITHPSAVATAVHARRLDHADRGRFDTLIYADVLEHIEDDRAEVVLALAALKPGGHLIVIVPAHRFLFSEMDQHIGHYRRYTLPMLRALRSDTAHEVTARYLDSIGIIANLANRLLLKQAAPSRRQILLWDRLMVPLSRLLDPLLGFTLGKSAMIIWQRA